jgi:hypothetical protein
VQIAKDGYGIIHTWRCIGGRLCDNFLRVLIEYAEIMANMPICWLFSEYAVMDYKVNL